MKSFLKWLQRTLAEVVASERGEFLSERNKARILRTPPRPTKPGR
jgi:hypothetical protein